MDLDIDCVDAPLNLVAKDLGATQVTRLLLVAVLFIFIPIDHYIYH